MRPLGRYCKPTDDLLSLYLYLSVDPLNSFLSHFLGGTFFSLSLSYHHNSCSQLYALALSALYYLVRFILLVHVVLPNITRFGTPKNHVSNKNKI